MEEVVKAEAEIWSVLVGFWHQKIFAVDQTPITIGTVVVGAVLLLLSWFFSAWGSRAFYRRVLLRLDIESSLKVTLRTLVFYFLLAVSFLFVLRLLNIPITIFAVLGGALAIGIGFGSQNIMNNFISGLIVMIERPVRINDLIEIAGRTGRVEQIGARSTIVRAIDGTRIVFPNSFILEKEVVNWTLSDSLVRASVVVGVAYGTNPEMVRGLLMRAATVHPRVLKDPSPQVFFKDFGDSALVFELVCWLEIDLDLGARGLESELRFEIAELFARNEIEIPFPQRDFNLKANQPLMVEMRKN